MREQAGHAVLVEPSRAGLREQRRVRYQNPKHLGETRGSGIPGDCREVDDRLRPVTQRESGPKRVGSKGRSPPLRATSTASSSGSAARGARPSAARVAKRRTSRGGAATVGRFGRSAESKSPASSSGSSAPISKASRRSREQEISAASATHSRARATPPFGRASGRARGTGSPPAPRTRSARSEVPVDRTPMRGADRSTWS